jgi:hypothetical protein
LAVQHGLRVWFTLTSHRHEPPGPDGLPIQLKGLESLFEVILQLQPEGKDIHVRPLKGLQSAAHLFLDPATMLLRD